MTDITALDFLDIQAIKYLRQNKRVERQTLKEVLSISYPTTQKVIKDLIEKEIIDERLNISATNKFVFWGISFGASEVKICLVDFCFKYVSSVEYRKHFTQVGETLSESSDEIANAPNYICYKTPQNREAFSTLLNDILRSIMLFCQEQDHYKTSGIGLAFSGAVDKTNGILKKAINIQYLEDIQIEKEIHQDIWEFFSNNKVRFVFDHNAKAAAIAEKEALYDLLNQDGSLRDPLLPGGIKGRNMLCLYLGTGVGAGLILDNRLYTGSLNFSGEIGHFPISFYGNASLNIPGWDTLFSTEQLENSKCTCGRANCFEFYVRHLDEYLQSCQSQNNISVAYQILGTLIGHVINAIVNLLNIDMVVCTGRLTKYYSQIEKHIQYEMTKNGVSYTRNCCSIRSSQNGKLAPSKGVAIEAYYAFINDSPNWDIGGK